MSKKFTRRQIVSSLGISGFGVIGLNQSSQKSLAANGDWTGSNVSKNVSGGTISDVTIPQSNISFTVEYRGLDTSIPLSIRIDARLQTEESSGSDEFDVIGVGTISLNSADGTVTESGLSLNSYSFPLGIVSNHSAIKSSDFAVGNTESKTTTVEIRVIFEQGYSTETITTAFDVTLSETSSFTLSKASYTGTSLDVSTEDTIPLGIAFNSDGTKLFMVGHATENVYSYNLKTAYDISTASYTTSLDVSNEDTGPKGVMFNSDGTKLFILGDSNHNVYSYDLTTAYDISTASYTGESLDISSEDTSPQGLTSNSAGTKLFIIGSDSDSVHEYDLNTTYDINTASHTTSFDVSSETPVPIGLTFNIDGTKLFISGNTDANLYSYDLTTAYDISTVSYTGESLDISSEDQYPRGLTFNSDGTRLFMSGTSNENVYSYSE